jgi:RimJ/RimL family protein N-acetyltransferase
MDGQNGTADAVPADPGEKMSTDLWRTPVTITGRIVRLEPLSEEHIPGLTEAGKDENIWKFMLYGDLTQPENMAAWVRDILGRQASGTDLPFTVIHLPSGRVAGATRFMEMRPAHKGLEIGGTWYAPDFQRTGVNTECKYLMFKYAFETMGCIRVQFKVDARNERSIRAIERLGAVREGQLRNHMILQDGRIRDSVYFSILNKEWPGVKKKLEGKLAK